METPSSKVLFQIYCFQRTAEIFLVPPLWAKKEINVLLFIFPPHRLQAAQFVFFWLQIVNTVIETSSCDDQRSIST